MVWEDRVRTHVSLSCAYSCLLSSNTFSYVCLPVFFPHHSCKNHNVQSLIISPKCSFSCVCLLKFFTWGFRKAAEEPRVCVWGQTNRRQPSCYVINMPDSFWVGSSSRVCFSKMLESPFALYLIFLTFGFVTFAVWFVHPGGGTAGKNPRWSCLHLWHHLCLCIRSKSSKGCKD